jgi:hypothetical protein
MAAFLLVVDRIDLRTTKLNPLMRLSTRTVNALPSQPGKWSYIILESKYRYTYLRLAPQKEPVYELRLHYNKRKTAEKWREQGHKSRRTSRQLSLGLELMFFLMQDACFSTLEPMVTIFPTYFNNQLVFIFNLCVSYDFRCKPGLLP